MIEDEFHFAAMSVDLADAPPKGIFQVTNCFEQNVSQNCAFQMPPETLDEIECGAVRRKPKDFEVFFILDQPFLHCLGAMKTRIVANQSDFSTTIGSRQLAQERQEVRAALALRNGIGDFARCIIDSAIDGLLFVLSWSGNLRLLSDRRPHAGKRWMQMDFCFVLKNKGFPRIFSQGLFFSWASRACAFRYKISSRLPLSVCLGR